MPVTRSGRFILDEPPRQRAVARVANEIALLLRAIVIATLERTAFVRRHRHGLRHPLGETVIVTAENGQQVEL